MKRRKPYGSKWRVLAWDGNERVAMADRGEFDELVVDDWFHIERMDASSWFFTIGDATFWVSLPHGEQADMILTSELESMARHIVRKGRK